MIFDTMNNCLCCFNLTGINEPREVVKEINGKEVKHTVKFTPEDVLGNTGTRETISS